MAIDKIVNEYILNLKKYASQIKTINKGLDSTAKTSKKATEKITKDFTNTGRKLNSVFAKLGVTIGAALALRKTIKDIADFEKAMANLSAITGLVGEGLAFMSDKAIELSNKSTLAAKDVAEAFKLVGSAKPELLSSGEALAEVTEQTILLAEASGLDLSTAVKALTDTLNQFGAGADEAARFVNVLAAGSKFGAAEVNDLSSAIVGFGTAAATAGVSIEQASAMVELLAEKGIKGAEAGIKLRNILLVLLKDTRNYTNGVFDLNKAFDNLDPIMNDTIKLEKLFMKQNVLAAQAVAQNRDRIAELTEQLTGTNTALEQAEVNTATLADEWKKLGNAWTNFTLSAEGGAGTLSNILEGVKKRLILLGTDLVSFWEKATLSADEAFELFLKRQEELNVSRLEQIDTEIKLQRIELTLAQQKENFDFKEATAIQLKIDKLNEERDAILGVTKAKKEDDDDGGTGELTDKEKKALEKRKKANEALEGFIAKLQASTSNKVIMTIQEEADQKTMALRADFEAKKKDIQDSVASETKKNEAIAALTAKFNADKRRIGFEAEEAIFQKEEEARQRRKDGELEYTEFLQEQATRRIEIERAKNRELIIASIGLLRALSNMAEEESKWQKALVIADIVVQEVLALAQAVPVGIKGSRDWKEAIRNTAILQSAVSATFRIITQIINSRNIPEAPTFAEGVIDLQGGKQGKDSIPALLMPGESVMTTKETKQYRKELEAMRLGKYNELIAKKEQGFAQSVMNNLNLQADLNDGRLLKKIGLSTMVSIKNTDRLIKVLKPEKIR